MLSLATASALGRPTPVGFYLVAAALFSAGAGGRGATLVASSPIVLALGVLLELT